MLLKKLKYKKKERHVHGMEDLILLECSYCLINRFDVKPMKSIENNANFMEIGKKSVPLTSYVILSQTSQNSLEKEKQSLRPLMQKYIAKTQQAKQYGTDIKTDI